MEAATELEIEPGLRVRVATAPYFCATKLEAFRGRGKDDYLSSHDLEDLITVVNGRSELLDEQHSAPEDVRSYIASAIGQMLKDPQFIDALPGYLLPDAASQARVRVVLGRLRAISNDLLADD